MDELDGADWVEGYAAPAFGDYDNDGDLDLFVTVFPGYGDSRLYRNDGGWNFTNVTGEEGLDWVDASQQAAWADFDNDGDLDLLSGAKLMVNLGNDNHWLKIKLVGDGQSVNSAAIGAQVRITVPGLGTLSRQVEAGTATTGNQNDMTLHFGLGSFSGQVQLEVLWPDGTTEYVDTPVDCLVVVDYVPSCGDWGYLQTDLDKNCYVDFLDWNLFAEQYMISSEANETIYNYQGVTTATDDIFAYACDVDTFPFGGNIGNRNSKVEATDAQYTAIAQNDSSRWETVEPGTSDEILLWLDMNIKEDINNIQRVDLTFVGHSGGSVAIKHKVYVMKTGTDWEQSDSWVPVGDSLLIQPGVDTELAVSITSNISDYVDPATGLITWAVYQFNTTSAVQMRINYVQMKVTGDSNLVGDFNGDSSVDLFDVADFVDDWIECTDPNDPLNCKVAL